MSSVVSALVSLSLSVNITFLAGWFGTTMTCVLLAINRFFEMIFPKLGEKLFSPNTMTFWLVIPIGYWVYIFMVMTPCLYNVSYHGFYYDPYYGTSDLEGNTLVRKQDIF